MIEVERKVKPLIVFNFEGTVTDFVNKRALEDIIEIYDDSSINLMPNDSMQKHKNMLNRWFKGKTLDDIEPLLDITSERAGNRLLPWAALTLSAMINTDIEEVFDDDKEPKSPELHETTHQICLLSLTTPEPILNAYADGFEDAIVDLKIESVFGKSLIKKNGTYTGELGNICDEITHTPKLTAIESLINNDGLELTFTAESFLSGLDVIGIAKRALIVNGGQGLQSLPTPTTDILSWNPWFPHITTLHRCGDVGPTSYDLSKPTQQIYFLNHLHPYDVLG